jgi:hypothetical protein
LLGSERVELVIRKKEEWNSHLVQAKACPNVAIALQNNDVSANHIAPGNKMN